MMKKIFMAAAMALVVSASVQAQDNGPQNRRGGNRMNSEEMIQQRTDRTVKAYNLNAEQAKQLLELNKKYNGRMGMGGMRGGFGQRGGQGGFGQRGGQGGFGQRGNRGGQARPDSTQRRQRPEMNDEMRAQMEASRKQMEETMKQYNEELQKIMTPEQFKSYQADQEKRRQGGPGAPRR